MRKDTIGKDGGQEVGMKEGQRRGIWMKERKARQGRMKEIYKRTKDRNDKEKKA